MAGKKRRKNRQNGKGKVGSGVPEKRNLLHESSGKILQEEIPSKKRETENSLPRRKRGDTRALEDKGEGRFIVAVQEQKSMTEPSVTVRERKAKHRSHYQEQKQGKRSRLQFDRMETDGSLKKLGDGEGLEEIPETKRTRRKQKRVVKETEYASKISDTAAKVSTESVQKKAQDFETQNQRKKQEQKSRQKVKSHEEKQTVHNQLVNVKHVPEGEKQEGKSRLRFGELPTEEKVPKKQSPARVIRSKSDRLERTVGKAPVLAADTAGRLILRKMRQEEQENSALQAADSTAYAGRSFLRQHSNRAVSAMRKQQRAQVRLEKKAYHAGINQQYRKYMEEHPQMRTKVLQRIRQKQQIKREYQKAYRAGKIAKETKDTAIKSVNIATRISRKVQEIFVRNLTLLISAGLFLALLLFIMTGLSSCSAMFGNVTSNVITASYIADPEEIEQAELYYTKLEANLQKQINGMAANYPGMDEYRYNISAIGHDPHTLISYLTAKYGEFTFDEVKGELEELFSRQYGIQAEEKTETRTETSTVQVGEFLGNVVTSGYCNCPVCCGIWSGGPTASGAMPQSNHTIAVDAANPFIPMGTKVVMNGVEYTVEDTGNFARYGVQFDVYYDSHAAASAHGHRTWACYLAEGNEHSVEVTRTVTVDVLNVAVQAKPLYGVFLSRMDSEEKEIFDAVYSCRGNLQSYAKPVDLSWYSYVSTHYGYAINNSTGETQLHRGVNINVRSGTEVTSAMEGIVTKVGYSDTFGNYVVTQDEKGVQIKYAYLQSIAVSEGMAVTMDTVIGTTGSTGSATGSQLYLEVVKDGVYYNPIFYIEAGENGLYGGAAYDDETVRRLFAEAEQYLGMPYVWGGSSPSTSFDCSGFVSYVFTNSGVYNIGRLTAQGIYNICTPISPEEARAGDIIFFTGTYNAGEPVTHVGIYAGDGQMIHCGDPIQYTSIYSAYWQSHFYGFGRLI